MKRLEARTRVREQMAEVQKKAGQIFDGSMDVLVVQWDRKVRVTTGTEKKPEEVDIVSNPFYLDTWYPGRRAKRIMVGIDGFELLIKKTGGIYRAAYKVYEGQPGVYSPSGSQEITGRGGGDLATLNEYLSRVNKIKAEMSQEHKPEGHNGAGGAGL